MFVNLSVFAHRNKFPVPADKEDGRGLQRYLLGDPLVPRPALHRVAGGLFHRRMVRQFSTTRANRTRPILLLMGTAPRLTIHQLSARMFSYGTKSVLPPEHRWTVNNSNFRFNF